MGMVTWSERRSADRDDCSINHWTSPKRIANDTKNKVARFPSIAAYGSAVYVVGNDLKLFDRSRMSPQPLTIWDMQNGGANVELPPGDYSFVYPKAVVDSKSRLHLFWGESTSPQPIESFRWGEAPISSIWWAVYERRVGWSKPQRILVGSKLDWSPVTSSAVLLRERGDIVFALPSGRPGPTRALFQTTGPGWRITPVPAKGAYATLASTKGRLFLAYVDALPGANDVNSVFALRSDDSGMTWTKPILVSRSGNRGAYELHAVASNEGSLHLVWAQDSGDGSSIIRHVSSQGTGTVWSRPQDLRIGAPAGEASLAASEDGCGGIHVIYENWQNGAEDRRLEYAHWKSVWSHPQRLFPNHRVAEAAFTPIRGKGVLLVFMALSGPKNDIAVSMDYAEGRP